MGEIATVLGCEKGTGVMTYLGMQIGANQQRKESWEWLVDRIKKRLARWDGKNISLGGRATLIQSVLSAIPIYSLSFFLLPKTSLSDIVRVQRSFLWGG
ncbi:hypothetical protein ACS0TY_019379 [Phlomoides rotata]